MTATPSLPRPRQAVLALAPVTHGGTQAGEGQASMSVLDFTDNVNPYGPPPQVYQALQGQPVDRLPDPEGTAVLELLARRHGRPVSHFLLGNGSAELMQLVALAYLDPGDRVLIYGPAFGEYQRVARIMAAEVHLWRAREEDLFQPRLQDMSRQLATLRPKLVFLCHPNNPTGTAYPMDWLALQAQRFPETLFVIDEAYHPFTRGRVTSALALQLPNVLVLRTLTKDHGLAGLRIGYAVGYPSVLVPLRAVRPPWNVNHYAQVAAVAALQARAYVEATLDQLARAVQQLRQELQDQGWFVLPSVAHFFLVRVGQATQVQQVLLQRFGLRVRDCTSFGLPAYIRVASLRPEENHRLLEALAWWRRQGNSRKAEHGS